MEITVFAKKRTTEDGKKTFYNYLSTLTKKDGEEVRCSVKFRDECGAPKPEKCPCNIVVDKKNANLSKREVEKKDGEIVTVYTLWVSAWENGTPYIDESLNDFE